jgi:hypothetical protein
VTYRERQRLADIQAVKALSAERLSSQPAISWAQIARMRGHLAHRYFDTDHAVLQATVHKDLVRWPPAWPGDVLFQGSGEELAPAGT